jgi:hypothetical protein
LVGIDESTNIQISNGEGVVVSEFYISPGETVDLGKLSNGVYFVKISTATGKSIKKLVLK